MLTNLNWGSVEVETILDDKNIEYKIYLNCSVIFKESSSNVFDIRINVYGTMNWLEEVLMFWDGKIKCIDERALTIDAKVYKVVKDKEKKINIKIYCARPFIKHSFEDEGFSK
jgi:hypothetical protein